MNILVTAIGKRVQLIKHLSKDNKIIGVDSSFDNVGRSFVDKFFKIPKCNEKNYINELLNICRTEKIKCLIPLYEGEFEVFLNNLDKFLNIGTTVLASDLDIVETFKSKKLAFEFMVEKNIQTPYIFNNIESLEFPVIIKPDDGMGSMGVFKAKNIKEVEFFKEYVENSIVQEFIDGIEYTVDVLCDLYGNYRYIIPRERLEVRAGEVVKSRTVKDLEIIERTKEIIKIINSNFYNGLKGPLTFQFIKNENGIYFLELNTRFGGGVPLSFECGADYSNDLISILDGERLSYYEDFEEITMLRYDEAVFR